MNKFIIMYHDADYEITRMNATFEEAEAYYKGNFFTFGTTKENEYKKQCVAVFNYDEWKHEVIDFCSYNNNTVLKFDDNSKVLYFQDSKRKEIHACTYKDVNETMKAPKGWTFTDLYTSCYDKPIYKTKQEAIEEAKKFYKSSDNRFIEIGWCILKNNQLNVINCERLHF